MNSLRLSQKITQEEKEERIYQWLGSASLGDTVSEGGTKEQSENGPCSTTLFNHTSNPGHTEQIVMPTNHAYPGARGKATLEEAYPNQSPALSPAVAQVGQSYSLPGESQARPVAASTAREARFPNNFVHHNIDAALPLRTRLRPESDIPLPSRPPPAQQPRHSDGWARFAQKSSCQESSNEGSGDLSTDSSASFFAPVHSGSIDGKWNPLWRIGTGSFGEVLLGHSLVRGLTPQGVAIKRERRSRSCRRLASEAETYRLLQGLPHFPRIHYQGMWRNCPVMVMDLLGPSLKDLASYPDRLRLSAVLQLALQMIDILQCLHSRNLVYRDIKPANFLLGHEYGALDPERASIDLNFNAREVFFAPTQGPRHSAYLHDVSPEGCPSCSGETPLLYLVDFGLVTTISSPDRKKPEFTRSYPKKRASTVKYASLAVHDGFEVGPLDDLEAAGYVLLDLLRGGLPWDSLAPTNRPAHKVWSSIAHAKRSADLDTLCQGVPCGLRNLLEYTRSADRSCPPDYNLLRKYLR